MGVRAATTAVAARLAARVSADPPVTQPPQLKPTIARAIAPATAPHRTERAVAFVSWEMSMVSPWTWRIEIAEEAKHVDRWAAVPICSFGVWRPNSDGHRCAACP